LQRALISEAAFDPRTARRRFSIALSDGAAAILLPPLVKRLRAEAPGIDLRVPPTGLSEGLEHVLSGEVDVGFGVYPNLPNGLSSTLLASTRLVCIADADHPRLAGGLDRSAFTDLPHVAVTEGQGRGSNIDAVLGGVGLDRRVMLHIPHFMLAPRVVIGTDLLAVMPETVIRALPLERLRVDTLPVETNLVTARMIWRERNDQDEAQHWLRGLIQLCFGGADQ
jgi:DNA-binding transcriptional LysR family regulator